MFHRSSRTFAQLAVAFLMTKRGNESRKGSSAVEQGTHKPLVGSSILPPGTFHMAWVYILRGSLEAEEKCKTINLSFATIEQPRKLSGLVGSFPITTLMAL